MTEMWPVLEGQQRAQDARQAALHALPASVDIAARLSTGLPALDQCEIEEVGLFILIRAGVCVLVGLWARSRATGRT